MAQANQGYKFVAHSWTSIANMAGTYDEGIIGGSSRYKNVFKKVAGHNGTAVQVVVYSFDGVSWTIDNSVATSRRSHIGCENGNFLYIQGGVDTVGTTFYNSPEKYNGIAWTTSVTNPTSVALARGGAVRTNQAPGVIYWIWGQETGPTAVNKMQRYTASEVASSSTASGLTRIGFSTGQINGKIYKIAGSSDGAAANVANTNESFNEVSWTNENTTPAALFRASGITTGRGINLTGGGNSAGTKQTTNYMYNGASWNTLTAYPIAVELFAGSGAK